MESKITKLSQRQSQNHGSLTERCHSLPSVSQRKPNYAAFEPNLSKQKIFKRQVIELPKPASPKEERVNLKKIIFNKQDRIVELEYFNSFLEDALKKREDITKACLEENVKLKEELKSKNKVIERLRQELKSIKRCFPVVDQKQSSYNTSRGLRSPFEKNGTFTNDLLHSYRNSHETKNLLTDRMDHSGTTQRLETDIKRSRIHTTHTTEEDHIRIPNSPFKGTLTSRIVEESSILSEDRLRESMVDEDRKLEKQRRRFKATSAIVTGTQGRRNEQSLFFNFQKTSILQMSNSEIENVFKNPELLKVETLLKQQNEQIIETLSSASEQEKTDILETFRAMDNDIKILVSIIGTLKKLLKAYSSISVSLVLYDALERIVRETCEILNCDRASVFLLDQANRVLWTKIAKGSSSTLKVPLDSGIAGCAATTGKAVRVDDAYVDERFSKEIDLRTNYRTKTILAMPIKDVTGSVLGVCQAINKLDGKLFTQDDEELFQVLSDQAGIMLKNSIKFDDTQVTHLKLNRLLKIGMEMYAAKTLAAFLPAAEVGLKSVFSSDRSVIYITEEATQSFYRYDEDNNKVSFTMKTGLIGRAATEKELIDITYPDDDPNFNSQVDINTHLPLLCLPLFSNDNDGKLLAIMQVSDLQSIGSKLKARGELQEMENLKTFMDISRICLEKLIGSDSKEITNKIQYHQQSTGSATEPLERQGPYSILQRESTDKDKQLGTNEHTVTFEPSNELNVGQYQDDFGHDQENKRLEKFEGKVVSKGRKGSQTETRDKSEGIKGNNYEGSIEKLC